MVHCQDGPPKHKAWNLTFEDTFETSQLDTTKWDFGFGWDTNSVAFREMNRVENHFLQDGSLVIRVDTMEDGEGWYSAAVNTRKHFSQHKGYFEARIKAAKGEGYINAFWSMPVDNAWPPEIDFLEILGKPPTTKTLFTVHWDENGHVLSNGDIHTGMDLSEDFHVYGCEWSDDYFAWYIDGEEVRRTTDGYDSITGYGKPFYMMLNVHVVSNANPAWTGIPNETNVFPAYMYTDWVRVYEKDTTLKITQLSPNMDDIYSIGSDIILFADAINHNGEIEKVDFMINDSVINTDTVAPFKYNWPNVPEGRYMASSMVTDTRSRELITSPVYITVGDISENMVFNPYFDDGTRNWYLDVSSEADASLSIIKGEQALEGDNSAFISIDNPGLGTADIELKQNVYLEKGKKYDFKFSAKSSEANKIFVNVRINNEATSILSKGANLTTSKQDFSFSFTSPSDDHSAKLVWKLGGTITDVYIDSVILRESKPSSIVKYQRRLKLFPTLVENEINIEMTSTNESVKAISITDVQGKIVYEQHGIVLVNENIILDVCGLKEGVYIISLLSNRGIHTGKFIKK
jgi:beta-glucanase (GH16 family)